MKYMVLALISILLTTGCGSSNNSSSSEQPSNDFRTSEAIVLSKQDFEGKTKLLITEDTNNIELLDNLEAISSQTTDEIIRADNYDLRWLEINNVSINEFDFDALKIGSKIRFITYTEQLDTRPPTSIAKEVNIIN